MQPTDPPYLSTRAAARRLHLSRARLRRAALRGALIPAVHTLSGALRFRVAAIDAYGCHLVTQACAMGQAGRATPAPADGARTADV